MNVDTASSTSEGLHFLRASYNTAALNPDPKEARIELNQLLTAAIRCRMQFNATDNAEINKLVDTNQVPGFKPWSKQFHKLACLMGSSFVGVWNQQHARAPATASAS